MGHVPVDCSVSCSERLRDNSRGRFGFQEPDGFLEFCEACAFLGDALFEDGSDEGDTFGGTGTLLQADLGGLSCACFAAVAVVEVASLSVVLRGR